ncbi:MAG: choice-of-anchor Q domain-containing protein [Luteolibacter sp.]
MKILAIFLPLPLAASATIVTTATDEDDSGLGKGTGISLREAVKYSPASTTITFAPALSGKTIRLSLGEIPIDKSLTIDASALPSPLKLSGDKTGNGKTSDDTFLLRLTTGSLTLRSLVLSDANSSGESSGCITISRSAPFNLLVDRCTLSGNSGSAAGVLYTQNATFTDTITLQNSTITGNSVAKGSSAVSVFYCALTIKNCTFANNTTGAIHYRAFGNTANQLSVENSTIVGNKASYGAGGIYIDDSSTGASLKNVILSGNTPADISGGFSGSNILLTAYPDLSPLGNYGGPTQTMPPNAKSPAIDRGTTTSPPTDQRGLPRVALPDIGAVEYQGDKPEIALRWNVDTDSDGSPYGMEWALGTNPSVADRSNTRNLTAPTFNASGHAILSFGIGTTNTDVRRILSRSTDLLTFTEIYRYNGSTHTAAPGITYLRTATGVTITDRNPPPGGAYYRFEARFEP